MLVITLHRDEAPVEQASSLRSPIRLRQAPKHLLVDPSLAVAGLQASLEMLREDRKTTGFIRPR
jgi:hypothetical protein